jgi:1-acyl-sn-glycerol-3-phosphate acyltransferase
MEGTTVPVDGAVPAGPLQVLRLAGNVVGLSLALFWLLVVGGLVLPLFVIPASWLFPRFRLHIVSWFMRFMSHGMLAGISVGGARFRQSGVLPTDGAGLIVMNHQSLLDILFATLMGRPFAPAFVTRARYARRIIPIVSTSIRLAGCPVIDPRRNPVAAIETLKNAVIGAKRTLLIFPEGHRTRTGEVLPFKSGGMIAMLTEARLPVWLVATDGCWRSPTLLDFVRHLHLVRGETELVGRYDPPADPAELPAFCERLREDLIAHLAVMRARHEAPPR